MGAPSGLIVSVQDSWRCWSRLIAAGRIVALGAILASLARMGLMLVWIGVVTMRSPGRCHCPPRGRRRTPAGLAGLPRLGSPSHLTR
jgi:hypothetical protein